MGKDNVPTYPTWKYIHTFVLNRYRHGPFYMDIHTSILIGYGPDLYPSKTDVCISMMKGWDHGWDKGSVLNGYRHGPHPLNMDIQTSY